MVVALCAVIAVLVLLRDSVTHAQCDSTILGDVEDFTVATQRIDFEHYPDGTVVPMGADDLDDEFLAFGIRITDSSPATGARAYTSTLGVPPHSGVIALADSDADAGGYIVFQFVDPQTGSGTQYAEVGIWIQTGDAGDTVQFQDSDGLPYCTLTTPAFGDYFVAVREPQGIAAVRVSSDGWYLVDDLEFGEEMSQPQPCTSEEKGDVDGNGAVNGADIAAFTATLMDPYGSSEAMRCRADIGGADARCAPDSLISFEDVAGLVQMILLGTCNEPPVVTSGATLAISVPKESACPSVDNEILLEAIDPDGSTAELVWTIVGPPANGSATFVGPSTGSTVILCYAPDSSQAEPDGLEIHVTDTNGDSATCTLNVTVINDPPAIDQGPTAFIDIQKNTHCPSSSNSLVLSAIDGDDATSTLEWSLSQLPNHGTATLDTTSGESEVLVCYEPESNQTQADALVVRVRDPYGAEDDISIAVTVFNAPPSIAEGDLATLTIVANSLCIDEPNILELHAIDVDDDVSTLHWEITAPATTGSLEFVEEPVGAFVRVCYEPIPNPSQHDAFEVSVLDAFDGADAIAVEVSILVAPPEILEGTTALLTIAKNSLCVFPENRIVLHATDPDGDDALLQWSVVAPPLTGYVDLPDGHAGGVVTICYEPDLDQVADDAFVIRVQDSDFEFADIAIDVSVSNAAPTIDQGDDPLAIQVDADSTCNDAPNVFVLSATDVDDLDTTLAWSVDSPPTHGVVSFVGVDIGKSVTICYAPDPGQSAPDQFVISVADEFDGMDAITAIISVDP